MDENFYTLVLTVDVISFSSSCDLTMEVIKVGFVPRTASWIESDAKEIHTP